MLRTKTHNVNHVHKAQFQCQTVHIADFQIKLFIQYQATLVQKDNIPKKVAATTATLNLHAVNFQNTTIYAH